MQEGRRRRVDDIYVRDWESFRKVQKGYDFIKTLNHEDPELCRQQIVNNFKQLIEDETKQCYVFPDSLKPAYIDIMKNLIDSELFKDSLDYEHEGMFLDKPKQLIVFKKRASVSIYLSKYRPTAEYKKIFEEVTKVSQQYQKLIIERNMQISKQVSDQQINKCTLEIQEFRKSKLQKKLVDWRKYVKKMVQDFLKQPKKQQMLFLGVNQILTEQLRQICKLFQLYISNRYQKVSQFDEYRDISLTKFDRSEPSIQSSRKSSETDDEQILQSKAAQFAEQKKQKQIILQIPKNVQNVSFQKFEADGAACIITILSFGKVNPTDYLLIRLISPKETEHQKNYEQRIDVIPQKFQYPILLHCLHSGCSTFEISAVNSVGKCKNPLIFQIYMEGIENSVDKNTGMMKLNLSNYSLYILGESQNGTIPNWNMQQKNTIVCSTNQKWQTFKFLCSQFDVSSHGTICNRQGDVASWGKLYYFDQEGINQETNSNEDQDEDNVLTKLGAQCYRIEAPSCVLENCFIRKVSCGDGYCLMADSLGRAWAFGINHFGQLGIEHTDQSADTSDPITIRYFSYENIFVTDVIASYFGASFAINEKGQAYRWGTNQVQQSNRPIKDTYQNIINYEYPDIVAAQSLPIPISKKLITQKIKSIHPGMQFVLALTEQNKLYGWGKTKYLGKGKMEDAHFRPIQNLCNPIYITDQVEDVSVGNQHVVMRKGTGLYGWGDAACYLDGGVQFVNKPEVVMDKFEGSFICGPDFTVFESNARIRVSGNKKTFKEGTYNLPCKPLKLKAGEGIIMMMGKNDNTKQQKSQQKQEKTIGIDQKQENKEDVSVELK